MAVGGILSKSPLQNNFSEWDSNEVLVVVAGKPGNGKSTALSNIFGVQLEAGVASSSVTKKIATRRWEKNGVNLIVVDTPGLGALNIDKEVVLKEMADILGERSYTLLYCLSVAPNCRFTNLDENIVRNLQSILGKKVWDRCVVLLTFSDTARKDEFEKQKEEYKRYIEKVAKELNLMLAKCGNVDYKVKTVFNFEPGTIFDRAVEDREIMVIPVGKKDNGIEDYILPDVVDPWNSWTHLVFLEIMRKTDEHSRGSFVALKYGVQVTDSSASSEVVGLGRPIRDIKEEAVEESGGSGAQPTASPYSIEHMLSLIQRHFTDCYGSSCKFDD